MNILFNSAYGSFSGATTWILTLAKQFIQHGHNVALLFNSITPEITPEFVSDCNKYGIKYTTDSSIVDTMDVIMLSYYRDETFINEICTKNIKRIATLHSVTPCKNNILELIKKTSVTISVSQRLQVLHKSDYCINNGIDLDYFKPNDKIVSNKTPKTALFFSRYKSHYDLNPALLSILEERGINVTLSYYKYTQDEVIDLINSHDFVIGVGRSAYEAMACKKPVFIASDLTLNGWVTIDNFQKFFYYNLNPFYSDGVPIELKIENHQTDKQFIYNEIDKYNCNSGIVNRQLVEKYSNSKNMFNKYKELLDTL